VPLVLFSVTFCRLAMPFYGCPYITLLANAVQSIEVHRVTLCSDTRRRASLNNRKWQREELRARANITISITAPLHL